MELSRFYDMHLEVELLRRRIITRYWEENLRDDIVQCLTHRQIDQLRLIHRLEPCSLKQLMQHLEISKSAASAAVEKLVTLGFVSRERSDGDQRQIVIRTTPDVHRHLLELSRRFRKSLSEKIFTLNEREIRNLEEISTRILEKLGKLPM